jgi:RNA polymerase sigma-70 factor (ECF subfamily)
VKSGASSELRGASAVAGTFSGRAQFAQAALVDGAMAAVWAPGGRLRVVFGMTISDGKILAIELIADPDHLGTLDVAILN